MFEIAISHTYNLYTDRKPFIPFRKNASKCLKFRCETSNLEPYLCKNCNFKTNFTIDFRQHLQKHDNKLEQSQESFPKPRYPTPNYTCRQCFFATHSGLHWLKHVKIHCSKDQINFFTQTLNRRKRKSRVRRLYECDQCPFKSTVEKDLKSHINVRHTRDEDAHWFECPQCSFKTKHERMVSQHILNRHTAADAIKWFECNQCPFKAKLKKRVNQHIKNIHTVREAVVWFNCERCEFKTKINKQFKQHLSSGCDECNQFPFNVSSLTERTVTSHTFDEETEWLNCSQCDFKIKHKAKLKTHMRDKHPEKWLFCDQCAYKTARNGTLKQHKKDKHSDQSYKCDKCSKVLKTEGILKRHVKLKHTSDEIAEWFECFQCPYKSKSKDTLKKHIVYRHVDLKWCADKKRFNLMEQSDQGKNRKKISLESHVGETQTNASKVKIMQLSGNVGDQL